MHLDILEGVKVVQAMPPESKSGTDTLWNGAAATGATGIDTKGFREALIVVSVGAVAAGGSLAIDVAFSAESTDATVTPTVLSGTSIAIADTEDDNVFVGRVKVDAQARYLYVKVVEAGNTFAKDYGINVLLSGANSLPVTQENTEEFDV
jgi:hypothetical protein